MNVNVTNPGDPNPQPAPADCSDPANNTSGTHGLVWAGILVDAVGSFPGVGDFGKTLEVDNLSQTSMVFSNWTDLRFTIKRDGFFQARCHDVSMVHNIRAQVTYRDDTSDVATDSEPCLIG
jgi:hypothetical protein